MQNDDALIDWNRIRELREEIGDAEFEEVVALFIVETATMAEALPNAPLSELEGQLHALKGAAMNLGFNRLAEVCASGERTAARGHPENIEILSVLAVFLQSHETFEAGLRCLLA